MALTLLEQAPRLLDLHADCLLVLLAFGQGEDALLREVHHLPIARCPAVSTGSHLQLNKVYEFSQVFDPGEARGCSRITVVND